MSDALHAALWPVAELPEALEALAHAASLELRVVTLPPAPPGLAAAGDAAIGRFLAGAAGALGLEVEELSAGYADVDALLRGAGPAILLVPGADGPSLLVLVGGGARLHVIARDRRARRVAAGLVRAALVGHLEAHYEADLARLLDDAGVSLRRRPRALRRLLGERLHWASVASCFAVRRAPGASAPAHARELRAGLRVALLAAAHAAEYALMLLAWWMVGRGALDGRFDRAWLVAWALLLVTVVPFRVLSTWTAGKLVLDAGALLKRRLLAGAFALAPNALRLEGAGQLLGRVLEASAVETLALNAGLGAAVAVLDLVAAGGVLALGPRGAPQVALFLAWGALVAVLSAWHLGVRRRWTDARMTMTQDLVERLVGHRTRLAQEPRERWHDAEDQAMARYHTASRDLDRTQVALLGAVPRGFLLAGLLVSMPAFAAGTTTSVQLAISLAGLLLGERALRTLVGGLVQVLAAVVAWDKVGPLWTAAATAERTTAASLVDATVDPGGPLLEARRLVYRHPGRQEPVLRGASLTVHPGDRILLEGPSGGGKSTLGSLLTGLRSPDQGLLLLGGLDRATLGLDGWRRRVVAAPQFQENHVLTGSFAFNLLMGRAWPPSPEDLEEAAAVCGGLGLGPLLARMPAGLMQNVGETGWQLSHGERSRLYIARALLQGADLVVLDESFAALDPISLDQAMRCVLDRARAVLVIAHP